jgi:hypothetical protein
MFIELLCLAHGDSHFMPCDFQSLIYQQEKILLGLEEMGLIRYGLLESVVEHFVFLQSYLAETIYVILVFRS